MWSGFNAGCNMLIRRLSCGSVSFLLLCGIASADEIRGTGIRDLLVGGTGSSTIYGVQGNDVLFGEQSGSTSTSPVSIMDAAICSRQDHDPEYAFYSPDETLIICSSPVVVYDRIRRTSILVSSRDGINPENGQEASISPDGSKVAFASSARLISGDVDDMSDIYVYDIKSRVLSTIPNGVDAYTPVFTPDSKKIMYAYVDGGPTLIFQYNLETKQKTLISSDENQPGNGHSAPASTYTQRSFSPDGLKFLFKSNSTNLGGEELDQGGEYYWHVKDLSTKEVFRIPLSLWSSECASFSPDGKKIVFCSGPKYGLYDIATKQTYFYDAGSYVRGIEYSRDYKYMFMEKETINYKGDWVKHIFVRDIKSGIERNITRNTGTGELVLGARKFSISRNGLRVLFSAGRSDLIGMVTVAPGPGGADKVDGGTGNDWVFGAAGDDRLVGSAGDDYLHGGSGVDTAIYPGPKSRYQITKKNTGSHVIRDTSSTNNQGIDTLVQVERISIGGSVSTLP
jgi:Tol biopolymer transport system component